jgi:hypothetical protein
MTIEALANYLRYTLANCVLPVLRDDTDDSTTNLVATFNEMRCLYGIL